MHRERRGEAPTVRQDPASAHVISAEAHLGALLADVTFDDVVDALLRLLPLAERLGCSRNNWLPTFLVEEEHAGRFGLCLDNPTHASGRGEFAALQEAMERLSLQASCEPPLRYVLNHGLGGRPHAAQNTFRLRVHHWRRLGRQVLDCLDHVLPDRGEPRLPGTATLLTGRGWRGPHRNPVRGFAESLSMDELLSFATDVARGPDALHVRLSFILHLSALRMCREAGRRVRGALEDLLDALDSEVRGDYHLDGQAAVQTLRQAPWDERLEVIEP